MTDSGYFGIQLDSLNFFLHEAPAEDVVLKLHIEILNSTETIKWLQHAEKKITTDPCKPFRQNAEESEVSGANFVLGFNELYHRSTYVDLTPEAMNLLANSDICIKIVSVNSNPVAAAPPAKGAKGAPPPPSAPSEENLVEFIFPMSTLLTSKGSTIDFFHTLDHELLGTMGVRIAHAKHVVPSQTILKWRIFADNDLAEYVMGSSVMRWQSGRLAVVPASWGLKFNDVVDPKAKVKPTAEELRIKYLEGITKLLETQHSVANFALTVGAQIPQSAESSSASEGEESPSGPEPPVLPALTISHGKLLFNHEKASQLCPDDDIRAQDDLWSVQWDGGSSVIFLHRSQIRSMAATIATASDAQKSLSVHAVKTPTAEGAALEGTPLTATGYLNVSAMCEPGVTEIPFSVTLAEPGQAAEEKSMTLSVSLFLSTALVPTPASEGLMKSGDAARRPADVISPKKPPVGTRNRDVLKEFREEIKTFITTVAREYVAQFPTALQRPTTGRPPSTPGADAGGGLSINTPGDGTPGNDLAQKSAAERKAQFLHYLTTSGIYHDLKEKLKPRIQRLVREKYGARGQALGKSTAGEMSLDALLGELYVFLVKESSEALNQIYASTMVDRDAAELEQKGTINDEKETTVQAVDRLLRQAVDAEADSRVTAAEQFHLERLQLIGHDPVLGSEAACVHDVYARLGEFYLRQAARLSSLGSDEASLAQAQTMFARGRQALQVAYRAKSDWKVGLSLACVLAEQDQAEEAEAMFNAVIDLQLGGSASSTSFKGGMQSLDDFEGYESDRLCPVDPLCYCVLAAYYSSKQQPLRARKALVLANRSFIEGGYKPAATTHGLPRRTIVFCLARACDYLFANGFTALGQEGVRLALDSEKAVTDKAGSRNLPAPTVPFIRHALKKAQAAGLLSQPSTAETEAAASYEQMLSDRFSAAVALAQESAHAAVSLPDIAQGFVATARALTAAVADPASVADACVRAFTVAQQAGVPTSVPLDVVLQGGKLLLEMGRYADALDLLLPACSVHTVSSALMLLTGICCLRLERLDDAEDALLEANLLDNRNPEVWAYLSLLCVGSGPHRAEEAEASLAQALRLNLGSASLLRELSSSFISVDKLLIAEDLIRRVIGIESEQAGERERANPRTRKLLADILAGQNQAVRAVDEYQIVLKDEAADKATKIAAGERCMPLLTALGRDDEARTLKRIMSSLSRL